MAPRTPRCNSLLLIPSSAVTEGGGSVIICLNQEAKAKIMPKDELTGDAQWWLDRVDIAGPVIEAGAQEADRIHELTRDGMKALHEQGMFRLLMSRKVGGAELPLPVFIQIVERVAQYDGSAAWCILARQVTSPTNLLTTLYAIREQGRQFSGHG